MDDNKLYNYWGKASFTDESFHLLVYHCLDVAAMGQVLLQRLLQQYRYGDVLTQNVTQDKEASISLITFFLALHDVGKFSKGFQNYKPDVVKNLHGELYEELNHKKSEKHDQIGFYLWQKMWPNIWQENWLNLDKNFDENDWKKPLDLWFKSIMNHHNRDQINDFSITQNNIASDLTEEDISTACFYVKKVADLLLDNKSKMKLLNMQNISEYSLYISDFLQDITVKLDRIILFDKSKYFPYNSRYMLIQQYWQKALTQAKSLVENEEINHFEIYKDNYNFFKNIKEIKLEDIDFISAGMSLMNRALDCINDDRNNDAVNCYIEASKLFKNSNDEKHYRICQNQLKRLWEPNIPPIPKKSINNTEIYEVDLDENFDQSLFDKLMILRKKLADKKGIPLFCIFHDLSLEAMAIHIPKDLLTFQNIIGVDESKLKLYGELFIKEIIEHCEQNSLS